MSGSSLAVVAFEQRIRVAGLISELLAQIRREGLPQFGAVALLEEARAMAVAAAQLSESAEPMHP